MPSECVLRSLWLSFLELLVSVLVFATWSHSLSLTHTQKITKKKAKTKPFAIIRISHYHTRHVGTVIYTGPPLPPLVVIDHCHILERSRVTRRMGRLRRRNISQYLRTRGRRAIRISQ